MCLFQCSRLLSECLKTYLSLQFYFISNHTHFTACFYYELNSTQDNLPRSRTTMSTSQSCCTYTRLLLIEIMFYSCSNVILLETESLSSHTPIVGSPSRRKTNCTQSQSLRSDAAKAYCSTVRLCLILSFENSLVGQ